MAGNDQTQGLLRQLSVGLVFKLGNMTLRGGTEQFRSGAGHPAGQGEPGQLQGLGDPFGGGHRAPPLFLKGVQQAGVGAGQAGHGQVAGGDGAVDVAHFLPGDQIAPPQQLGDQGGDGGVLHDLQEV